MAIDWMTEALNEIRREGHLQHDFLTTGEMRAIIAKHSPFKPDVAFMPVPRCDACEHYEHYDHHAPNVGLCFHLGERVQQDFGCVAWKAKT